MSGYADARAKIRALKAENEPEVTYPDSHFKTVRAPGNGPDETHLTEAGRLAAYAEAAESVWPGLTLKKEHVEALEQVSVAGPAGVPTREVKRGWGDAFYALSNARKDPSSFQKELAAGLSCDEVALAESLEENALIRLVRDESTYSEAYHLTRLGKKLMDAANKSVGRMLATKKEYAREALAKAKGGGKGASSNTKART